MDKDLYAVLGVAKDASQAEIKKAYKKLARELHPDLNPGDKQAEERFKEVSAAYEILGDPEKRARYDRGEIDATGAERPERQFYRQYAEAGEGGPYYSAGGFEDFEDLSDIFSEFFGRRRAAGARAGGHTIRMRGPDAHYSMEVDFLDAARGAKKRITLPTGETIDLAIPEGTRDSQVIRLRGKGGPGIGGGPPGDAFVEIHVRPHPLFERRGDDIHVEIPISIDEAVLGGSIEVPTIDGRVKLRIPPGTSSGRVLRMRGKGVKRRGGGRGDQLVTVRIVLPEKIDPELEAFMKEWRRKHAYDPRRGMVS